MSEHIQSAPTAHAAPLAAETHERTPGVSRESERFNFWLLFKVGVGLAAVIATILVVDWFLLHGLDKVNTLPAGSMSTLALDDAKRPLGRRLENVPAPLLEGVELESSILVLRAGAGEDRRFFVAPNVHVQIDDNKDARLFELREGQRVTIAYHVPSGKEGDTGVINTATSPPEKAGKKTENEAELSKRDATRTQKLTGVIVKLEPRGIAAARQWAEVRMKRYGWSHRQQNIVHVPIEQAMKEVLQSPEFHSKDGKKKGDGRTLSPTRSSSGREPRRGKP